MPEVWQLTFEEFIDGCPVCEYEPRDQPIIEREHAEQVAEVSEAWIKSTLKKVEAHENYWFASIRGRPFDVALLEEDEITGEFTVVGGYVDCYLWIDGGTKGNSGARGKHLAPELVLAKAEKVEGVIDAISFTPSGYKSTAWAHYLAVKRARERGEKIPEKVLNNYPEFKKGNPSRIGPYLDYKKISLEEAMKIIQEREER